MANQIKYQVGFDIQKQGLNQLKASLQQIQKLKFSDIMKINNTDLTSARDILRSVQQDAGKVEEAFNKAFNTKLNTINIESFNKQLNKSNLTIESIYKSFSKAGATGEAAFRNLSTQLLSTNIQLKESHTLLDKMAKTLTNTVKWNLASGAINTVSRSIEQAWGYTKSLDASLNNIRIVTGKSAEEMGNFAIKANEAAQGLGKTTTDYTNAALIYAQQGLSDKEIEERTRITLMTANVTGQSASDVSEELTAVWNGYKVNAEEAELYIDRLAAIAATTASDLEELSTGMSKVASAAAAMGVGEDQLAAQLSTIISVTRQAPESVGTALRTVYARISDIKAGIDEDGVTLGNYSGKMAELGFNVLDAAGNLRDMGEVMQDIGNRWQDLTREQQISLAQTMAGQRQYSNLIALFDNFEKYNEALETARNATGTLQEQQDIYMQGLAAHLQKLKAAVENIYDSFTDSDSINSLIDELSVAANLTANLIDSIGGGGAVLKSLGAIGVTVFSKQIGAGLVTTINNLERARVQAEYFKNIIAEAQKRQEQHLGNDYTQFLNAQQTSFLTTMGGRLPVEDFNAIQSTFQKLSQNSGEIEILEEKIQRLNNGFSALGEDMDQATAKYGTLDELLSSANGVEIIKEGLNKLYHSFDPVLQKQKEMHAAFDQMYKSTNPYAVIKNFNLLKIKIKEFIDVLKSTKIEDSEKTLFENLPEGARKAVESAQQELQKLKFDVGNPEQASQKIKLIFANLNSVISKEIQYTQQLMKDADQGTLEKLQTKLNNLTIFQKQLEDKLSAQLEKGQRIVSVQNMTDLAGGIAQFGSAMQQISNIGRIFNDNDLKAGQKLLQIVTNLAISLPMLVTGFTKAATGLGIMTMATTESQIASIKAAIAENAHAKSLGFVKVAATEAGIKVQFFDKALTLSSFGAFLIAATAIISILNAVANGFEEANRAAIQNNNETIENAKSKQEQYEKNKELYDSLDDLNQQYKDGQITRNQLKTSVENLVEQYGLEDDKVKDLIESYGNLEEAVRKARGKSAEENLKIASERRIAAEDNIIKTAKGGFWDSSYVMGKKYTSSFNVRNATNQEELSMINKMLQNATDITTTPSGGEQAIFSISTNMESMQEYYNSLKDIKKEYEALNPQIRNSSNLYRQIKDEVTKLMPVIKEYQDSLKVEQEAGIDNLIYNTKGINPYAVDSVNDYVSQRKQIIDFIKQNYKDVEDAESFADNYLRKNFGQLYSDFNGIANLVDKVDEKFKDKSISEIEQTLSQIKDYEHFGFLEDLKLDNIKDWQDFENIVKYLSEADLSNLKVVANPQGQFEAATEQYNLYSSLSEQIAGSKKQTINKKEYQTLQPEIQKYFERMANGQYKMTGDAEEFYNTVNNLSLDGFKKNIEDLKNSNTRLKNLQNIDFNQLSQSAATQKEDGSYTFQQSNVNQQLDFLTEMGYDLQQIVQWQAEIADGYTTVNVLNDIAEAVSNFSNQTDKLSTYLQANEDAIYQNELALGRSTQSLSQLKQYYDKDLIGIKAFTQAAIELDAALDIKNLDNKQLDDYAKHLQEIADQTEKLDDELKDNEAAAKIVAKGIMKMNNAIETLSKNWKNWSDIIDNSSEISEEYAKAMGQAQQTVADLLDVSKDYVSEDFIKQHLNDITEAATGSETAIDDLKSALAQNIVANIIVENKLDEQVKAQVLSDFADLQASIPDLQAGATLKDGEFLTKAQQFLQDCHATVDQANAIFDAIGFEANFATEQQKVTQRVPKTITKTQVVGYTSGTALGPNEGQIIPWEYPILQSHTYNDGYVEQEGTIDVPALATNDGVPKINTLTKKAPGSSNNYSSSNSGGNSAGGKKGGGGGGGKTQQPSKSKAIKPDREAKYHDVNKTISKLNKEYSDLQKKREKTYGKQLQDVLKDELKILEKQIEAEKEKQEIIKKEQEELKKVLELQGAIFDPETNEITNYEDLILKIEEKRKQLDQKHDAMTKDQQDAFKEQYQKEKERLEELTQLVQRYVTLQDRFTDSLEQQEEYAYKQIQKKIEDFRIEIEVSLDMGQAERKWNEFERNVLNHSDILKESNFDKMFKDIEQGYADVLSYFDVNGQGSIEELTNQLLATQEELDEINSGGESSIYGTDKKRAMEDLQNDLDELMQQMQDIESLIDNIDQAYLDTIDDISEQFDKQIDNYGLIGDLIEHDIDLLSLLYGDKNYEAMDKYYTTLHNNNLKQLDSLKRQRDFWKEQWDAAVARGDSEAAKQFEEHYKETIGNLNSLIEESAENLKNKYINAIDSIFDDLDKKISGGLGTNYLETSWDLMKKNADEYLDTINSAFAVQDLENKFQKAINDTKVLKNQQALKKLMDQQLNNLKTKEKLTEYDVQRAEKLLQIEQARIALEDAQASKTSMRLKRDAQGNYSYEYVADESNISEAEQGLATAQNDLYNFDKDRYNSNLEDILGAWKDFQEQYKDIMTDSSLSEDQRVANSALLREQYGQYINDKTAENLVIRNNLQESAFADIAALYRTDVDNYKQMSTDEQNILMNELVPTWESGIQQMTDRVAGQGGFIPVCQGAFEDINQATLDYQNQLDEMANVAGIDLQNVKGGVDDLAISFGGLITKNEDLITTMGKELSAVEQLKNAAHALMEEYNGVYDAAKDAVSVIHEAMQENRSDIFDDRDYNNDNDNDNDKTYAEQLTGKKYPTVFDFQKLKEQNEFNSNETSHPFGVEEEVKQIEAFSSEWFDELERQGHIVVSPDIANHSQTIADILDWKKFFARLDTGGYTGDWSGNEGKLAVLHKKELVLNADDTENLFNTMSLLKSITDSLNGDLFARTSGIKSGIYNNLGDSEELEQNVHIDASFPNVNSKREIEEALSDLVNLAAQRAMRK